MEQYSLYWVWMNDGGWHEHSDKELFIATNTDDAIRQAKEKYPWKSHYGYSAWSVHFDGFYIAVTKI